MRFGLLFILFSLCFSAKAQEEPAPVLSPVIWVERPEIVQRFAVNADAVQSMLNTSLCKLTSTADVGTAWKRLGITPQDTVGIKITTTGGPLLCTHRALIESIVQGLKLSGVPARQIIIWDKFRREMLKAGFSEEDTGEQRPQVASVIPGTGFDDDKFYNNEILGSLIWGDNDFSKSSDDIRNEVETVVSKDPFAEGSSGSSFSRPKTSNKSYFARLETQICTKIINVPVLTDSIYVGLNGCLASLAIGSVDNDRRFQGPSTYGNPAIGEILNHDFIRRKVVIHILDALMSQYAGGPAFNPQFCQPIGALYVSRDPVAIDSLVLPRLEKWRARNHIDPLGRTASHVHEASFENLGTDDPRRIQLIRLP